MPDELAPLSSEDRDALHRALLRSIPHAVFVIADGRVAWSDDRCARLFGGASPAHLTGRAVAELVAPQYREAVERRMLAPAGEGPASPFDAELVRRDGSAFRAELVVTPCTFGARPARHVLVQDVADRRRIEAARDADAESARRMSDLFERAQQIGGIGCWTSEVSDDPSSAALWWSSTVFDIFGVDRAAFAGTNRTFIERVHPEDRGAVDAGVQRAIAERRPYEIEHRIVRPDGVTRWVREWADVEHDAATGRVRLIGVCQDVTSRRAMEARVREADRMDSVARLAGGVAHDFNNLLTVVLGSLDLAERHVAAGMPPARQLAECRDAALRAANLTGRLLAFARRQTTQPRPTSVTDVARGCLPILRRLAGEDVALVFEEPGGTWHVHADPSQIEQVLVNLVSNAREAMPHGGRVRICVLDVPAAAAGGRESVDLLVADDGPGIAPDVRGHIFEPFFSTRADAWGTGLGLATCHGIVTQAGGTITAEDAPGGGALLRVRLPRVPGPPAGGVPAEAPAPAESATVAPAPGATILVVEDEAALRRLVAAVLTSAGFRVITAGDGASAIELVERTGGRIDLVLSDVVMPGLDGRRTVERLREARPDLKALFMSGYNDDPKIRAVPGSVLIKPFTPTALVERVRAALES